MSLELVVRNHQRVRKISVPYLRRVAREIIAHALRSKPNSHRCQCEIGIHVVGANRMAGLNRRFLDHEGSTDVITLDYGEGESAPQGEEWICGDIFVCMDEAIAQAKRFRTTWQSEVVRYIIHGFLHLRGYDDVNPAARGVMKREESRLLKDITRRFPLRNLDQKPAAAKA